MRLHILTFMLLILSATIQAENLRIEVEQLADLQSDSNIVIIDVRSSEEYLLEHIPGAINLPDSLSYHDRTVSGLIIKPNQAQKLFRSLGLHTDQNLVIYDDGSLVKSARVLWMLEVYGFSKVKILNGGIQAWRNMNLPLTDKVEPTTPSDYVVQINPNRIASKFATQLAMLNPRQTIVDARPMAAFDGKTSSAVRFGHIPGAINFPVQNNFITKQDETDMRKLLESSQLSEIYRHLPKDNKIIIYCEEGTGSSTNYLVLRELGYNVANYDASWREWGNDLSLPIEK